MGRVIFRKSFGQVPNPISSVVPSLHVEVPATMTGHPSSTSFSDRHESDWKNRFNELPVPENDYFKLLVDWAHEVRQSNDHLLILNCLDFIDPGDQVSLSNLSPSLKSYLPNFYQFVVSHLEKSIGHLDLKPEGINPDSPLPSLSGNKDVAGSEYGSPNMDQDSTNAGSPSLTSSIRNLTTGTLLLFCLGLFALLSYILLFS